MLVHHENGKLAQHIQMYVIFCIWRCNQKQQSDRFAVQGVEIHAIFDDHRRQPRLFDRITFSMRNCNPLADTGRALFFSRINLLAECLDIRQLSARRHQLYRLVQCLRFAGGCRIQRYTSRIQ